MISIHWYTLVYNSHRKLKITICHLILILNLHSGLIDYSHTFDINVDLAFRKILYSAFTSDPPERMLSRYCGYSI